MVFRSRAVITVFLAACLSEGAAHAFQQPPGVPGQGAAPGPTDRPPVPPVQQTSFEAAKETFPNVADGRVAVRIRASVNGVPILDEEVREACIPFLIGTLNLPEPERSARQQEIFRAKLQQLIDQELLLQDLNERFGKQNAPVMEKLKQAAEKEFDKKLRNLKLHTGCKTDEDLKTFLAAQGLSLEGMRKLTVSEFMATEYLRQRIFPAIERVGHEEIYEYYRDHQPEFQVEDSVKWQDIFVDASRYASREEARRFAEQIASQLRAGQKFSDYARFDNGDSAFRNGEGLGRRRGEIRPVEAEPLLFKMQNGEVGPVVEIATGFHVIRLVERTRAGRLPLNEKVQDEIRKKLRYQAFEREQKRFLADLRGKATVELAGNR